MPQNPSAKKPSVSPASLPGVAPRARLGGLLLAGLGLLACSSPAFDLAECDRDGHPGNAAVLRGWRSPLPRRLGKILVDGRGAPRSGISGAALLASWKQATAAWEALPGHGMRLPEPALGEISSALLARSLRAGDDTRLVVVVTPGLRIRRGHQDLPVTWTALTGRPSLGYLAHTPLVPDGHSNHIRDADILLNDDLPGGRPHFTLDPESQPERTDLVTVLAHEIGHLLGGSHSEDPESVMHAVIPAGVRRLPGPDDARLLRFLYPLDGKPDPDLRPDRNSLSFAGCRGSGRKGPPAPGSADWNGDGFEDLLVRGPDDALLRPWSLAHGLPWKGPSLPRGLEGWVLLPVQLDLDPRTDLVAIHPRGEALIPLEAGGDLLTAGSKIPAPGDTAFLPTLPYADPEGRLAALLVQGVTSPTPLRLGSISLGDGAPVSLPPYPITTGTRLAVLPAGGAIPPRLLRVDPVPDGGAVLQVEPLGETRDEPRPGLSLPFLPAHATAPDLDGDGRPDLLLWPPLGSPSRTPAVLLAPELDRVLPFPLAPEEELVATGPSPPRAGASVLLRGGRTGAHALLFGRFPNYAVRKDFSLSPGEEVRAFLPLFLKPYAGILTVDPAGSWWVRDGHSSGFRPPRGVPLPPGVSILVPARVPFVPAAPPAR